MDDDKVTISLRRDAAHYLSMLLGDQLVSLGDAVMNEHILPILQAYQHANQQIEHALAMPLPSAGPRTFGGYR
jgi:hypothetical protein